MPPICPMTVGIAVAMTAVSRLTRKVATKRAMVTRRRADTHRPYRVGGLACGVVQSRALGGVRPVIRRLLSVLVLSLALVPVPVGQAAEPDSVNVFFSRDPDSFNDFAAVFPLA